MQIDKDLKRNIFLGLLVACLLLLGRNYIFGQNGDRGEQISQGEGAWLEVKSAYFNIYYRPDANLKRIYSKLNGRGFSVTSTPPASTLSGFEAKVAYRFDMLFARAKEILGMYPADVRVNVKIFKSRKDVYNEFCRLTRSGDECQSFYIYTFNTIYTSEQDISDSIMAHEMGHALVDNYFSTTPPERVGEILAQNVDQHLDD